MEKFSLTPGDSLDIVGLPDIEVFKKFIEGDLGISESMLSKSSENLSAGQSEEVSDILNKRFDHGSNSGLLSLEKTIAQSIMETQKPYIEVAKSVLSGMTSIEDIICVSLAGFSKEVLRPPHYENSLYSKLNGMEETLNELNTISNPISNPISNYSEQDKINGIDILELNEIYKNTNELSLPIPNDNSGDYITVSIFYSTGEFIKGIPYDYSYRLLNKSDQFIIEDDNSISDIKLPIDYQDIPPILIFDIWVDVDGKGENIKRITDINEIPWDISDKWVGEWDSWNRSDVSFKQEFDRYIDNRLEDEIPNNISNETKSTIKSSVKNSIPYNDTDNDIIFKREYYKNSISEKLKGQIDPYSFKLLSYDKFGFVPKKINENWIDPDSDYFQQVVKVVPSKLVNKNNINLINNPLVFNYDGNKISDVLIDSDYDIEKFESLIESGQILNRNRYDNTHYDNNGNLVTDKNIYYIVEGVYMDRKNLNSDSNNESNKTYKFGNKVKRLPVSIVKSISKFIKFGITFLSKIIESCSLAIKTFTDPFNLIFEILILKLGENFDIFSRDQLSKINSLSSIGTVDEKKKFVENDPQLKNYVSFDDSGNYRLLSDGSGSLSLLGAGFGIGTKGLSPKLTKKVGVTKEDLLLSAKEKIENSSNIENSNEAESISLKLDAMDDLQIAQSMDKNDDEVNSLISKLQEDTGVQSNSSIQFIIDIISLPIKVIKKVIEYVLDFFKSLKIPKLVTEIPKFLKFEWITDFFKPTFIFELLGIEINPSIVSQWKGALETQPNSDTNFDTSEIFKSPGTLKLLTYSSTSIPIIINNGNSILLTVIKLFEFVESIINEILCFLFNVFNIDKIIKCPKIKLSELIDESLSIDNINDLLSGQDQIFLDNVEDNRLEYVYDIKLSNGDVIRGLSLTEVKAYSDVNNEIEFIYL